MEGTVHVLVLYLLGWASPASCRAETGGWNLPHPRGALWHCRDLFTELWAPTEVWGGRHLLQGYSIFTVDVMDCCPPQASLCLCCMEKGSLGTSQEFCSAGERARQGIRSFGVST